MAPFGFGLEKIGYVCLKFPKACFAIIALTCAISVYGLTFLEFDGDPSEVFRADNEISRSTDRFKKAFPSSNEQLVLLIESKKPYNAAQIEAIRSLHLEVQFVKGVVGVSSILSPREKVDKDGNAPTLVPAELPGDDKIPALLKKLYDHPLAGDLLLSKDFTTSLMIISFERHKDGLTGVSKSLESVDRVVGQIAKSANLTITQTGGMAVRYDVLKSLYQDVHMLNLSGSVLAITICFIFFRNVRLVLVASLPPVIAVLWVLGIFGLTGRPVTAMNNVLPTLVLVIAFCDALHMVQTIRRRLELGDHIKQAVKISVRDVGPACAMTSLTTMVACASLMLSSSHGVREFGAAGTVSVFLAFISVISLVPALSVVLWRNPAKKERKPDYFNTVLDKVSEGITALVSNFTAPIVTLSSFLLIVSGYAYISTQTNYDYRKFLSETSPANYAIDRIDKKFGGADVFSILVETEKPSPTPPKALLAAQKLLEADKRIRAVFSIASIMDWTGKTNIGNKQEMDDLVSQLPPGFRKRLVSPDEKSWAMTVYIPNTKADQTRNLINSLDKALDGVRKAHPQTKLSIAGGIARSAYSSPVVIGGLKFSLAVAVFITILMVGIFVRSLRFALLSAIPNLLPLTLVALFLFVTGDKFTLIGVMALTIAFGIAIDNTIHVVNRLQLELKAADMHTAMAVTIKKTAPVLFAATLLLVCGMIVTRFSQMPSIQIFGGYMTAVLVLALFAAIIVLPAMILATEQTRKPSGED